MFQLDREVRAWCSSILPDDCSQDERLDELEDHLYSEIERLQAEGLSEEQAFTTATNQLGEANMLMSEFSKNRSFVSRLCALDRQLSGTGTIKSSSLRKTANRLIIGHAILWAAAMLATALLMRDSEAMTSVLTLVMVPLWFASFLLINGAIRSLKPESRS